MERRTRIWIGLGTALLVGGTGVERVALARETPSTATPRRSRPARRSRPPARRASSSPRPTPPARAVPAKAAARCSARSPSSASRAPIRAPSPTTPSAQVAAYADLVHDTYAAAQAAAAALQDAVGALRRVARRPRRSRRRATPGSRRAAAYLRTEAFLFYAGPVDGPGGPLPAAQRLAGRSRRHRRPDRRPVAVAELPRPRAAQPDRGAGQDHHRPARHRVSALGRRRQRSTADAFAGEAGARRGEYARRRSRSFSPTTSASSTAAWAPGTNNYRASVEAMDQRNALGRAFNGMTVLRRLRDPAAPHRRRPLPRQREFPAFAVQRHLGRRQPPRLRGRAAASISRPGSTGSSPRTDAALAAKVAAGFDARGRRARRAGRAL